MRVSRALIGSHMPYLVVTFMMILNDPNFAFKDILFNNLNIEP